MSLVAQLPPKPASRVAPAVTVVLVAAVVMFLPGRYHLLPPWFGFTVVALIVLPMIARSAFPLSRAWFTTERITTLTGSIAAGLAVVITLAILIGGMITRSREFGALSLLASSTSLWMTNVLTFALIYWAIDNGGPDHRAARRGGYADLMFAQAGAGEAVPPDWLPGFTDYLFVSFTTQTAFSPTDTLPLTSRAKALMMLQSLISLVTLVVVASRAIGILQ